MAAMERQATGAFPDGRHLEDRLARTVEALRERRLRLARLAELARHAPGEQDPVDVIDAAMAVDAATAQVHHGEAERSERRRSPAQVIPPNAVRCGDCGTIWYSRLADQLVTWARCARCDGTLHTERRR